MIEARVGYHPSRLAVGENSTMAQFFSLTVRILSFGAIAVVAATACRHVYLRAAEEGEPANAEGALTSMMLDGCEAMHRRLNGRQVSEAARSE